MRPIKFRGKRKDNGEWHYGGYFRAFDGTTWILGDDGLTDRPEAIEVEPSTVGEFAGEHEKLGHKGKEIYEGDIVEINTHGINYDSKTIRGIVNFVDGCFEVKFSEPVYDLHLKTHRQRLYVKCFVVNRAIKVIGNIHEPELLQA